MSAEGTDKTNWSPLCGAVTGLTKALGREFPELHVRALDLNPSDSVAARTTTIIEELVDLLFSGVQTPVEIGRFNSQRVAVRTLPAENLSQPGSLPPISEGQSIIISGGGRGITAEVLKGLLISKPLLSAVANSKTRLVILGRTRLPENVEELESLNSEDLSSLMQKTATELRQRGERATPVQIDHAFEPTLKAIAICKNIKALRSLGANVVYLPCDVSDEDALNSAMNEIKRYGLVAGVLHAAGTDESKRLAEKTPEAWDRVFRGKALGAIGLARMTQDQPLRFFIMFGSIAGRFGNSGQADYCAASDVLAKLAHSLRALGVPASTYDWSAWRSVGMATRGSVLKVLEAAGVEPLSIEDGVKLFLEELLTGHEPEIVLARALGSVDETSLNQIPERFESTKGFLAGALTELIPGVSTTAIKTISEAKDAYLADHHVGKGVPYLPGVFGLESFIESSKVLMKHASLIEMRDVMFHYPVKVIGNSPINCKVRSEISKAAPNGAVDVRSQLETPSGINGQYGRVNASATLRFNNIEQAYRPRPEPPQPLVPLNSVPRYSPLFLGPSFQLLTKIEAIGPRGLKVHACVPKSSRISEFSSNQIPVIEAGSHAAGVWGLLIHNAKAIFHSISQIKYVRTDTALDEFELELKNGHFDGKVVRCDVDAKDVHGNPILCITGLEIQCTDTEGYADEFHPVLPFPHEITKLGVHEIHRVPVQWVSDALSIPKVFDELLSPEEHKAFSALDDAPLKRRAEWMAGTLAAKASLKSANHGQFHERPWNRLAIRHDTKVGAPPTVEDLSWQVTITHAGKWGAAVAYDSEIERVGVDVDLIEDRAPSFLEEAFSAEERAVLRSPRDATRAWCIKEAVLKSLGVGLKSDLHQVSVDLATSPPQVKLADELMMAREAKSITVNDTACDNLHVLAIAIIRKR